MFIYHFIVSVLRDSHFLRFSWLFYGNVFLWDQKIWDEIGEPEIERDKMLCQLEQECLEAYRRKVDQASRSCAQLRQAVAESEAELARICAALGEQPVNVRQVNVAFFFSL